VLRTCLHSFAKSGYISEIPIVDDKLSWISIYRYGSITRDVPGL
jgi:hypothetical protein